MTKVASVRSTPLKLIVIDFRGCSPAPSVISTAGAAGVAKAAHSPGIGASVGAIESAVPTGATPRVR